MINGQNFKIVAITPPAAIIDNAAVTTTAVDTAGFDYCTIVLQLGATDIAMTALAVQESDAAASGFANVTGLIWGTSANTDGSTSALPIATDDNLFQIAQVDLRGRKRYLDLSATVGDGTAGTYLSAFAILTRADQTPTTMAEMGANEVLRV